MFLNRIVIVCIFIIASCNIAHSQEEKEFKIDQNLYSYYQKCQEHIGDARVMLMADTLFSQATEKGDKRMQAVALTLKLDHHYFKGDNEDSIVFYVNKVKDFATETDQLKYYYFVWSDRLILHYLKTGNINIALYQALEMLKDAQQRDSKIGLLSCYNNLYQIYKIKNMKSLSNEYCLKAIELTENYEMDNYNVAFLYTEAAKYYINQCNMEKALAYLKKADEAANADLHLIAVKLAYMHYYLAAGNLSKAWDLLQESKRMFDHDKKLISHKKMYYENEYHFYKQTGQYQSALQTIDNLIEEELKLNEHALRNGHYRMKGEIYLAMSKKELAATFLAKYIQLEDSVRVNDDELTTSGFATLVNLEKVEREKKELLLRAQEKELRNTQIIILFLVVVLILVLVFLYRENKLNKRLLQSKEELKKAKEKAEQASQAKTRFIQSMSHEIRTPLNSIVGFSQIIGSQYKNDPAAKEYASIIETNSNNLLRLISYALELSDLDKCDNIEADFVTDVNNCCRVSMQSAEADLQNGVELKFKPSCEELVIHSNPERIMQVLSSLLHNAAKFTAQGSITLGYLYSETDRKIYFSVADTGCGIPSDKHEEVFERFFKLDSFAQGTGLGLSISKEIAERMNGSLYIDKEYTKGTRFVFVIPYK